eukprot:9001899-Pyramimonas_sp.AAC.1
MASAVGAKNQPCHKNMRFVSIVSTPLFLRIAVQTSDSLWCSGRLTSGGARLAGGKGGAGAGAGSPGEGDPGGGGADAGA